MAENTLQNAVNIQVSDNTIVSRPISTEGNENNPGEHPDESVNENVSKVQSLDQQEAEETDGYIYNYDMGDGLGDHYYDDHSSFYR